MLLLLEVSDPARVAVVPLDTPGPSCEVREVACVASWAQLLAVVRAEDLKANSLPAPSPPPFDWCDPDNDDDDDVLEPTPLVTGGPEEVSS